MAARICSLRDYHEIPAYCEGEREARTEMFCRGSIRPSRCHIDNGTAADSVEKVAGHASVRGRTLDYAQS
jgi:hypothetical protein